MLPEQYDGEDPNRIFAIVILIPAINGKTNIVT
jgi:hypothetical protein